MCPTGGGSLPLPCQVGVVGLVWQLRNARLRGISGSLSPQPDVLLELGFLSARCICVLTEGDSVPPEMTASLATGS